MSRPKCTAVGFWGRSRYVCELDEHPGSAMHENNAEHPGVIWFGDHGEPCACGGCPPR